MSIQEILFFGCSNHATSAHAATSLRNAGIPFTTILLDTDKDRKRAKNGKYIAIQQVPTLLVITTSNVIERYIGFNKIVSWVAYNQQQNTQQSSLEEKIDIPEDIPTTHTPQGPAPPTSGLQTGPQNKSSPMLSVMEIAKQMSAEASSKWEPKGASQPPQ